VPVLILVNRVGDAEPSPCRQDGIAPGRDSDGASQSLHTVRGACQVMKSAGKSWISFVSCAVLAWSRFRFVRFMNGISTMMHKVLVPGMSMACSSRHFRGIPPLVCVFFSD
jgi:hypothetical protein